MSDSGDANLLPSGLGFTLGLYRTTLSQTQLFDETPSVGIFSKGRLICKYMFNFTLLLVVHGYRNSKTILCLFSIEQMSDYFGIVGNQRSHCERRKVQIWNGKKQEPYGIGLYLHQSLKRW